MTTRSRCRSKHVVCGGQQERDRLGDDRNCSAQYNCGSLRNSTAISRDTITASTWGLHLSIRDARFCRSCSTLAAACSSDSSSKSPTAVDTTSTADEPSRRWPLVSSFTSTLFVGVSGGISALAIATLNSERSAWSSSCCARCTTRSSGATVGSAAS